MSAPMIRCARCQDTGGILFEDDGPGGPQPGPCPDCRGTPADDWPGDEVLDDGPGRGPGGRWDGGRAMRNVGPLHQLIVRAHNDPTLCPRCLGSGRIASTDDGESWLYWLDLEPPANLAVRMGMVRPLSCPDCDGSGLARATADGAGGEAG